MSDRQARLAFEKLMRWAFLDSGPRKPGRLLRHLTEQERIALRRLTSDRARKYRHDHG